MDRPSVRPPVCPFVRNSVPFMLKVQYLNNYKTYSCIFPSKHVISARCRADLHSHIGPTSVFYVGPISDVQHGSISARHRLNHIKRHSANMVPTYLNMARYRVLTLSQLSRDTVFIFQLFIFLF